MMGERVRSMALEVSDDICSGLGEYILPIVEDAVLKIEGKLNVLCKESMYPFPRRLR